MSQNKSEKATKQAKEGVSPISGVAPPKNRQFGKPGGNPRHNGAWKKEDTARYKLEKMITLSGKELQEIALDEDSPEFEKAIANLILSIRTDMDDKGNPIPAHQRFKTVEGMMNQVYGAPVAKTITKETDENDGAFIKGYLYP